MADYGAPYFPPSWLEQFLGLLKRIRISEVNRHWIADNGICSVNNASKVVSGLKFLKLVDEDGKVIEDKMGQLKLEGEPFKTALQKIVMTAYSDLLNKIDINKAHRVDVLNYFISTYQYSKAQAQSALRLFVYLVREANMTVSEGLMKPSKESKIPNSSQSQITRQPRKTSIKENQQPAADKIISDYTVPGRILISIKGKGLSHHQEITSAKDIKSSLGIIEKLIELQFSQEEEREKRDRKKETDS